MTVTPGQLAASVLLPPFGVYLRTGAGRRFWIASGLTMLAVVPGVIFALWTALRPASRA